MCSKNKYDWLTERGKTWLSNNEKWDGAGIMNLRVNGRGRGDMHFLKQEHEWKVIRKMAVVQPRLWMEAAIKSQRRSNTSPIFWKWNSDYNSSLTSEPKVISKELFC